MTRFQVGRSFPAAAEGERAALLQPRTGSGLAPWPVEQRTHPLPINPEFCRGSDEISPIRTWPTGRDVFEDILPCTNDSERSGRLVMSHYFGDQRPDLLAKCGWG